MDSSCPNSIANVHNCYLNTLHQLQVNFSPITSSQKYFKSFEISRIQKCLFVLTSKFVKKKKKKKKVNIVAVTELKSIFHSLSNEQKEKAAISVATAFEYLHSLRFKSQIIENTN